MKFYRLSPGLRRVSGPFNTNIQCSFVWYLAACALPAQSASRTAGLLLDGAHQWSPTLSIRLVQDFGLETEVAAHLARTYGDRAFSVAKMAGVTGKRWPVVGKRIHEDFPYIDAEVSELSSVLEKLKEKRSSYFFLTVQIADSLRSKRICVHGD